MSGNRRLIPCSSPKEKGVILLLTLLLFVCVSTISRAKEIKVGLKEKIRFIKDAIALADSGDVISVGEGIYREGEIVINKPVSICGTRDVIVDGNLETQVFTIKSSFVTIEGIVIQNSGKSDLKELSGIRLESVTHCVISNCWLINNFFSIYLANSSQCTIIGNKIESNARTEASSGNGIHLWKSVENTIRNNHISGQRDGIYFEFVKNSVITGNTSEKNLRYGLHFMFSDNCSYSNNTFRNNGSGVAVMYTKNVTMKNNVFEHNWGGAAYGLLLKEIGNSEIANNTFEQNTTGIYMEGSNKSSVHHNIFKRNGWAMRVFGDCYDNTITQNNFSGNTFDVATNAIQNMNVYAKNYWDKYSGYDLNHDGVGDIPFHPVSLYSKVTEDSPYALMLLHSFFVDLMDQTEKMMPSVTPEAFRDDLPQMKQTAR